VHADDDAIKLAQLEIEVSMLRDQLAEVRADRDAWREQASRRWWHPLAEMMRGRGQEK